MKSEFCDFLIDMWHGITGNMRPWAKIVFGAPCFIVCIAFTPICIVAVLFMAAILLPIDWIGKKIRPLIFKDGETT